MKIIYKIFLFSFLFIGLCNNEVAAKKNKKKQHSATSSKAKKKKKKAATAKAKTASKEKATKLRSKALEVDEKATVVTNVSRSLQKTAQQLAADTIIQKEVTITSEFKPSLRNAAKINFSAATPLVDTNRLALTYSIPSQNLFFSYQPVAIKPLALLPDSFDLWKSSAYAKVGFGNFSAPYLEANMGWGNHHKNAYAVGGKFYSATGSLPFQQYNMLNINGNGNFIFKNKTSLTTALIIKYSNQYKYGIGAQANVSKDDLRQVFTNTEANILYQHNQPNNYGIAYNAALDINYFFDSRSNNEFTALASFPFSKTLSKAIKLQFVPTLNLTHFNGNSIIDNNVYSFNTSLLYSTPQLTIHAGLLPVWDNNLFHLLPNIKANVNLLNQQIIFLAGIESGIEKNTYKSLADKNPFIQVPQSFFNTQKTNIYAGIKGNLSNHLTYKTQLGMVQWKNAALFINDMATNNQQTFNILQESKLNAIQLSGELSYLLQENLTINTGIVFTQFTKSTTFEKVYGWIPLELNGHIRWKIYKDLYVKSDVSFFDGATFLSEAAKNIKLNPALDINAGVEMVVAPKLSAWVQLNNLLNNTYQRWNGYRVLGFQLLGGIYYKFN